MVSLQFSLLSVYSLLLDYMTIIFVRSQNSLTSREIRDLCITEGAYDLKADMLLIVHTYIATGICSPPSDCPSVVVTTAVPDGASQSGYGCNRRLFAQGLTMPLPLHPLACPLQNCLISRWRYSSPRPGYSEQSVRILSSLPKLQSLGVVSPC